MAARADRPPPTSCSRKHLRSSWRRVRTRRLHIGVAHRSFGKQTCGNTRGSLDVLGCCQRSRASWENIVRNTEVTLTPLCCPVLAASVPVTPLDCQEHRFVRQSNRLGTTVPMGVPAGTIATAGQQSDDNSLIKVDDKSQMTARQQLRKTVIQI